MLDLIEQSTLYRLIAIIATLISLFEFGGRLLGGDVLGTRRLVFRTDLSQILAAALLGGFLFPIVIILLPDQVGALLYEVFSFGNPSFLVIVGLILGALFGTIYREILERLLTGIMFAIGMAVGVGFMAFVAGGIIAAIGTSGSWGTMLDKALSWGRTGTMIGAILGLIIGLLAP